MKWFDEETLSLDDVSVASYGLVGSAIFLVAIVVFRVYDHFVCPSPVNDADKKDAGSSSSSSSAQRFAYDLGEDLLYGLVVSVGAYYTVNVIANIFNGASEVLESIPEDVMGSSLKAVSDFGYLDEGDEESTSTVAL